MDEKKDVKKCTVNIDEKAVKGGLIETIGTEFTSEDSFKKLIQIFSELNEHEFWDMMNDEI